VKRLFLLRHAKASRDDAGIRDEDRPLAERGREDALRLGRFLREEVYVPDLVLCSPSARTRETLAILLPELHAQPVVQYPSELYLAAPGTILSIVHGARDTAGALMVIGHNPGLEVCARELVRAPEDRNLRKRYRTMTEKFSTGALAIVDFEVEQWSDVGADMGELETFVRPKDLRDKEA